MISKKWMSYATRVAIAALVGVAAPVVARAGDVSICVSREEADAFGIRQLQSRLMVAALACNQSVAYNGFVEHFRPRLASAGFALRDYFKRSGGGEPALNRHITELANVAGLSRAEEPENFCADTWTMFLLLEDEPDQLPIVAAKHLMQRAGRPKECSPVDTIEKHQQPDVAVPVITASSDLPVIKTAAP